MVHKPHVRTLISLLLALSLAACSYNPLSSSNHTTGTAVGTAAGGIAGFGTAAAFGVTSKPLLGLATIGGASIGYYISSLRFDSAGIIQSGGQVYTLGDYLTIEIPTNKLFDDNSADLLPDGEPALISSANVLNRLCCQSILVSGNSSGFASAKFERRLTEERARVVAAFLWAQGVNVFQKNSNNTRTLTYVGYGNYFPIAENFTNKGIRANSRIQITAYPTKDQLLIDKKKQVFSNMGGFDEPPVSTTPMLNADNAFPVGDVLPEKGVTETSGLKGAFNESATMNPVISPNNPKPVDFYQERVNVKAENFENDNRIEKAFQATESRATTNRHESFNGYKGEGGFKD